MRLATPIVVVLTILGDVRAEDSNCGFSQNVEVGKTHYLHNPGYPFNYVPGTKCNWHISCPPGYNCRVDCKVDILKSDDCELDRLLVSRTGINVLSSADLYCDKLDFTAISLHQKLSLALISPGHGNGGKFNCKVVAQPESRDTEPCSCGQSNLTRVWEDQNTSPGEYPSTVALVERDHAGILCGGVMITNKNIVTSAHCTTTKMPEDLNVLAGYRDTSTGVAIAGKKAYGVLKIQEHPSFYGYYNDYDIAIVTLTENIELNEYASPICLPFRFTYEDFVGERLTIVGWDILSNDGPSEILQKVQVEVMHRNTCERVFSNVSWRQICSYSPGLDACEYDSGAQLIYTDRNTEALYLAGIVSSGRVCATAKAPGVHTRVAKMLDWIEATAPAEYCKI